MLPIIFFSVIFGIGLGSLAKETKKPLIDVLHAVAKTMFKVTRYDHAFWTFRCIWLIAATVANFGFSSLLPLVKLALLVYGAIFFFIFVILGLVANSCGFSIWEIIKF